MQLNFIRGDAHAPRGHAIIIVRPYGRTEQALATYCIVLPISFSLGRYLPPILSSQLPLEGLAEMGSSPSVMPVPPMLEDVKDLDDLINLGELRDDDVVEITGVDLANDAKRMELAAQSSNDYGELYLRYIASKPAAPKRHEETPLPEAFRAALEDVNIPESLDALPPVEGAANPDDVVSDREHLGQVARLLGTLRYALEGKDSRLLDETQRSLRQIAATLAPKYRIDELLAAATQTGATGQKLADLYLTRAYRLLDEDYPAIPPLEQQIKDLQG